tara:strand:+ start:2469 stop:3146 length:678 start_codon:yes stop_codon:yes gene_type:complete
MRTVDAIEKIKTTQSPPAQLHNVLTSKKIKFLLDYYHNSTDKVKKNTGPSVLYVKEGQDVIDDILEILRKEFGNFKVRSSHFFDVTRPHIIHNDDDKDYPNCYKAFTIPLWCAGADTDISLAIFDQFYYHGPAKFINGDTRELPVYYNEFVREYSRVCNLSTSTVDRTNLSHLHPEWLEGLSINTMLPWKIGSILAFNSLQLHSSTDFVSKGINQKIGLSIFTTI